MLTKHVAICLVFGYAVVMAKALGRTARVVMTPEAKVLKQLRYRHGLSMRLAGERLGISSTYISQIENGRENVPSGERLMKFLKVYGDITEKYFKQLCKEWRDEVTELDMLIELAKKLPAVKLKTLLALAEQMSAGKI